MSEPSPGRGRSTFFHHNQPVTTITYLQPTQCDNSHLIWGSEEARPSTKTALEAAPNPFSELFDNLSHLFSKTLYVSPLESKTGSVFFPKPMIPLGRGGGG